MYFEVGLGWFLLGVSRPGAGPRVSLFRFLDTFKILSEVCIFFCIASNSKHIFKITAYNGSSWFPSSTRSPRSSCSCARQPPPAAHRAGRRRDGGGGGGGGGDGDCGGGSELSGDGGGLDGDRRRLCVCVSSPPPLPPFDGFAFSLSAIKLFSPETLRGLHHVMFCFRGSSPPRRLRNLPHRIE